MNRAKVMRRLMKDEQYRPQVYDDATGTPIRPGSLVVGHPTIGYGFALDVNSLSPAEAIYLLDCKMTGAERNCRIVFKWFEELNEDRQGVIVMMAYQMGLTGVSNFAKMIEAIKGHDWEKAATEMLDSHWANIQSPARAKRLAEIMRTGEDSQLV